MGDRNHPTAPAKDGGRDVCGRPGAAGSRPRWPDREIGDIASRQEGLITRLQLIALGVDRHTIDHALKRGRLRLIHRGVYALGHTALPPSAMYLAAVLAVGEGALLSHRSALAFWGLIPRPTGDVDVTVVGRDAGRRRPGIRVRRVNQLDPRDAAERQGIPVTTAARALLDVAADRRPGNSSGPSTMVSSAGCSPATLSPPPPPAAGTARVPRRSKSWPRPNGASRP